jgi:flagellar motility protein MotE (MotC chaperone)
MIEQIVQKIITAGGLTGALLVAITVYFLREIRDTKALHEKQTKEIEERYQRNAEELKKVRAEKDEEIKQVQKQKDTEVAALNEARIKDYEQVRGLLLAQAEKQIHVLAETASAHETTADVLDNLRQEVESLRQELSQNRRR